MTYAETEESGGVRALRAWVMAATKRALRLYPPGSPAAGPDVYDRSIAELGELMRLLEHDAELRATVAVQFGSVLAMRHLAKGGVPADRERAQLLLREARDPATATGAATDADDRRWAALSLLSLVLPLPQTGVRRDQPPSLSGLLDWHAKLGPAGIADAVVEIRELLDEVEELPLPPEQHEQLRQTSTVLAQLAGPDSPVHSMRAFTDAMSGGVPHEDELRRVTDLLSGLSDPPAEPEPVARTEASTTPGPAPSGTEAFIAMNAVAPSLFEAVVAFQSGDPEALNRALGRLRDAHGLMPGHELGPQLEMLSATLLQMGQTAGGNLHDQALGRTVMETLGNQTGLFTPDPANPLDREFAVLLRVVPLSVRLRAAHESEDVEAVRTIHAELVALETETPRDHKLRYLVMAGLAQSCITLAMLTNDGDMMLLGADYFEQVTAAADSLPPLLKKLVDQGGLGPDALRARVTNDATLLRNHTPARPDAPRGQQWLSTMSLALKYGLTHDPADLPPLIGELEWIRDEIRQGQQPWYAADALWQLAVAYRARWHHTEDATAQAAATDTALEALHVLAGDVVLQRGAEHGLLTARSGAERGVRTAVWAASQGRVEDALAALELGRALVLHAASTSRAVPELLEARGHEELAATWRTSGTRDASADDGPPGELPSALRRRALEALGHRQQRLFTSPTVHELADGLAKAGADALVYLLPGKGETPGVGIVVGPDHTVGVGGLPLLSHTGSAPLDRYLDAAAARSRKLGHPAAEQAWEAALSELCDWAYRAGLEEVLHAVEERLDAGASGCDRRPGPLRIVLVPCGRLGVVPWHAARLPAAAPHDYVCQSVVISYASSGGQLLQTIKRARRDPTADPVLIADPRQELTHAEREATALYEAFYPRARTYGEFYEPPVEPVATGTPDEVLALLSESPSLLHVASHGSAGVRPTVSALHLAFPDGTDVLPPKEGGPGAEPDLGMLTVTRLLDRPWNEERAPQGPLVVLSACETDLSTRDHDEALTLTTAFVSSGARNVVGSRWTAQDGASALMMAVFHHYLAVERQGPADALRAAQLWMLDPDRKNPGSLSGELLREIQRPGLERLPVWAAFIHQGHPGPGQGTATTAQTAPEE